MRWLMTAVCGCIAVMMSGCTISKEPIPTHDTGWMHYEAPRKEKKVDQLRKEVLEEFLMGKSFLKPLRRGDKASIDRKLLTVTRKVAGSHEKPFTIATVPGYEDSIYRAGFKYVIRVVMPYQTDKHDSVICITDDNHKIYDVIVGYDN